MPMNKRQQVINDGKIIEKCMGKYTGMEGCHIGAIAFDSGERQFFCGGRSDLIGMCLAELIANMVQATNGIEQMRFIDGVAEMSKEIIAYRDDKGRPQ